MTNEYDDIIHLPHHVSKRHPQMAMLGRAAQFAPFAALTGYDAAIRESGRTTEDWIEQDEYRDHILNQKMQQLISRLSENPIVTIEYFLPEKHKSSASYHTMTDRVRRIDEIEHVVELKNGKHIPIRFITGITMVEDEC